MANNSKKYVSLARLSDFLDNIKLIYAKIGHKHTVSDITDYKVDDELSPTSVNPVQNKVIDSEFEAIGQAMGALELAIDGKSDSSHDHNELYYTETEIDEKFDNIDELPSVSTDDNGKTLQVVDGVWTAVDKEIMVLEEKSYPFDGEGEGYFQVEGLNSAYLENGNNFIDGETYRVVWDESEYICVAKVTTIDGSSSLNGDLLYIGNSSLLKETIEPEEPFLFITPVGTGISPIIAFTQSTNENHIVGIYHKSDTDMSLSKKGEAADAKAVSDGFRAVYDKIASLDYIETPTSASVGQVLSVQSVDDEGKITWETVTPESVGVVTDPTLSNDGEAADAKVTGDAIAEINSKIADLMYEPISITSFTNNVGTVEIGSTVTNVTLSWKTSKTPTALTLDGASIDTSLTSTSSSNMSIATDKTWTLVATDERDATSTKTTKITFLNGVYYGVVDNGTTINNEAIIGLTKKLQSTKSITFTTTANDGQYIVYALPADYGTPAFNVGGFDGGFSLKSTFDFTNASGHTESYCVWISDNTSLGATTVKVS